MNLRKAENYDIGLDIGTGSVGWAVTDETGELYKFKGKPTWGSRLFKSADPAADTRLKRSLRRRYARRRQRLDWLQGFFAEEMQKVDSDFFIRLKQSRLWKEDRNPDCQDYHYPLFNDSDFSEIDYYQQFPTIYHLREYLVNSSGKADIRLVYLALHHIVKHRGNFLYQDNKSLTAKSANIKDSIEDFSIAYESFCKEEGIEAELNFEEMVKVFEDAKNTGLKKKALQEKLKNVMHIVHPEDKKFGAASAKEIAGSILGYKSDFAKIFDREFETNKFALNDEESTFVFISSCGDDCLEVFEKLQKVYSAYVLSQILSDGDGKTISSCKVKEYEQYKEDLKVLKSLTKEYKSSEYKEFFCGKFYEGTNDYDAKEAKGYTKYNLGQNKSQLPEYKNYGYDVFKKDVEKLFANTAALDDERYINMMQKFEEERFLRRLRTSDNGAIPFQLHLEEMQAIINHQKQYYPFLDDSQEKIESLVTFRIPYYVGPLSTKNAAKDSKGKNRFAWSVRQEGMENVAVTPWNWEEVIDKDRSAEKFILRMTGECTYLRGEDVLPRCSLVYEEYCVLNELNGAKWSQDGDKFHRFSFDDRSKIVEELFRSGKSVSRKRIESWLERNGRSHVHVSGFQGETRFVSKLSSYGFFCTLLDVEVLNSQQKQMAEEMILWNTLFEDRSVLKERVKKKYGDKLTSEQINKFCRKRFLGWGKLSKEFLCGIKTNTDNGPMSIMDILIEGNPNNSKMGRAMNLMEILRDDKFDFEKIIEQRNEKYLKEQSGFSLNDLPGSPAIRRSINQALKIIDEIVYITGEEPSRIYIEVTRDEDPKNKGRRTRARQQQIEEALKGFKKENPELWEEWKVCKNDKNMDDRLMLYFMQEGKSMYSGKPLDIHRLSDYQIDHIIPQCVVKDNSFDNRVLVLREENQRKTDQLLIDPAIRSKMSGMWRALYKAGAISKKKFNNLMCSDLQERQIRGFIARQLVETSQTIKLLQPILAMKYPHVKIVPVKAAMSHDLREETKLYKCREINNFHHAHDAYFACRVGQFINAFCSDILDNPTKTAHVVKKMLSRAKDEYYKKNLRIPGSANYVLFNMMHEQIDQETGELLWDPDVEIARMKKALNIKSCYISRMPVEDSGAFWKETVYSPRHMKGGIPLKKDLSVEKYGGYSSMQFAYFFIYKAKDKKGKLAFRFEAVPVYVASEVKQDDDALRKYAQSISEEQGEEFVQIVRKKIYKYQLIEIDGCRLYITGKGEVRNATEAAFSVEEAKELYLFLESLVSEKAFFVFEMLAEKIMKCSPRTNRLLSLKQNNCKDTFLQLSDEEQRNICKSLLDLISASKNVADLRRIGLKAGSGRLYVTFNKELLGSCLIDVSPTGMFERRQYLEL